MKKLFPLFIIFCLVAITTFYFLGPKDLYVRHDCNLQKDGMCKSSIDDIELNFKIQPLPLRPTQEVTYQLEVVGTAAQKATVRLLGHDMRMEEEQVFDLEKGLNNSFKATRLFPLCTEEIMIWRLYLIIEAEGITLRTLYDLRVKRG